MKKNRKYCLTSFTAATLNEVSADMKRLRIPFEVSPFGNIGTSPWVFLERTHVNKKCETELTGRWWRLQNCCTTLLPKLCCDRSLSLEKTLQLRSLWSLGKAKRTWDEKVVKVSNGAGKVFRQKNHFEKCVCNEDDLRSPLLSQSCFAQNSVQPFTGVQSMVKCIHFNFAKSRHISFLMWWLQIMMMGGWGASNLNK